MATEDRAILKEVGIMERSGIMDGGQDKAVFGINGLMLFYPEVRHLVFDGPVTL